MPEIQAPALDGGRAIAPTQGESAYQVLRTQILNSDLQPGMILSERLLADRLRVGKAPIRMALQRLASEGFVVIEPRRGVMIASQSIQDVVDLFQIRHVVEQLAVRGIVGKLGPGQVERLRANLEWQKEVALTGNAGDSVDADFAFHRLLCEFHGNRHMVTMFDRILDSLYREIRLAQSKLPNRLGESIREHEALADAIVAGEPEEAARLIEHHLRFGERFVLSRCPG